MSDVSDEDPHADNGPVEFKLNRVIQRSKAKVIGISSPNHAGLPSVCVSIRLHIFSHSFGDIL